VPPPPATPATREGSRPHAAPPVPVDTAPVEGVGRETHAYREKLVQPPADPQRVKPVGDVIALLGNTLRRLAPPVGTLLAPVQPLVTGLRGIGRFDFPDLVAAVSPGRMQTLGAERGAIAQLPSAGPTGAYRPPSVPTAGSPAQAFQAASARPPAAEVGGRPVSPPPGTAPAPVAGGAAAVFSGGTFVPFLALLVLAALAAPRLMRRLDELPAFVRPGPFLCALERPG
jgi:hypothetical protein